jgi:hypothetical protein
MKTLPEGRYAVYLKEKTFLQAVCNGHLWIVKDTTAISTGEWVRFYVNGKQVWECNAMYAAAHFIFKVNMKEHKCKWVDYCICRMDADEPNENCPIHSGAAEWPPRCMYCGRFLKWATP